MTTRGVCRTANYIAAARAVETERNGAIINDPWAREFATEEGFEMLEHFSKYRISTSFSPTHPKEDIAVMICAIRTKFFDTHLLETLENDTDIKQVVILGCGFDTRSCRLSFPDPMNTKVFEVDLEEVIKIREEVLGTDLAPKGLVDGMPRRAKRISVSSDVSDIDILRTQLEEASFNPNKKSVWILEGLLVYLPEETVQNLLHFVSSVSLENSVIMVDIHNPATLFSPFNKNYNDDWGERGAPLIWGTDFPEDTLRWHGYITNICARYGDKQADFGRFLPFLDWLLDSFPRENKNVPNTFVVVGTRNNQKSEDLCEWENFLLLTDAKKELDELSQWILPERTSAARRVIEYYQSKLFTHLPEKLKNQNITETEVPMNAIIPDELD